ncbi:hypothetical protein CLV78_102688 [Aliiruegeria haliotis]|uniref:Uncharacterized protein n=1 Tax=Aliiruegeria haliotis TaxID=1280846 RepID=A0A2T0RWH2_9RHOB|nr:hypothetical protein [Aliiruegeria haliotis]PRY25508.1 hypothetical protein CLV78_102688 [Aliiruegeria haliotis]
MREVCRIDVYSGSFASQPLVFAHLGAAMPGLRLDDVEVICGVDPRRRLAHAFLAEAAEAVEDAMGLDDTCVLIFPDAVATMPGALPDATDLLRHLGTFDGHRHRPEPE